MVAVFTGQGLGFFQSSLTQLGQGAGSALGQSRGGQLINLATGNVVLRDADENLLVRGLNSSFVRTYNSRGSVSGVGQDAWITGYERSVVLDTKLNADGSWDQKAAKVRLLLGDGEEVVFSYLADNTYRSTAGDGAHDLLTWESGKSRWIFTEGGTNCRELYDSRQGGKLVQISDLGSGATVNIIYDANGRVSEARSVDGAGVNADALLFSYNAAGQLISVSTREAGVVKSQVSYEYDSFGRLSSVTTDLTPEVSGDNVWNSTAALNDGKSFRTNYIYVTANASDLRIASVTTGDGTTVAYTYESDGTGGFRVKTMTEGSGSDGSAQTVSFTYRIGATDVADAAGRTWTYEYDIAKQLTAILEPAVSGLRQKTSYTYDADGNVIRSRQEAYSGAGSTLDVVYKYDSNGNRTLQRDLLGNTVVWAYNAANLLTTETRYNTADADGLDPTHIGNTNLPSGALTTRYIYDPQNRVRFTINAAGEVGEMTYATVGNGIGRLASERRYQSESYSGAYTEAALNTWATDTAAKRRALSSLTNYVYDVKGRLQQTTDYATVTALEGGMSATRGMVSTTRNAFSAVRTSVIPDLSRATFSYVPSMNTAFSSVRYGGSPSWTGATSQPLLALGAGQVKVVNTAIDTQGLEFARARDFVIAPDAHGYTSHGGWVTDSLLQRRAWTAISPGDVMAKSKYPSTASAFHTDSLLEHADNYVRSSGIFERELAANPMQKIFNINPSKIGDLEMNLGRGYEPIHPYEAVGKLPFQGPLQRIDNMSSVGGFYRYNTATQTFDRVTLYPAVRK